MKCKNYTYLVLSEFFSKIIDVEVEKNLRNNFRCLTKMYVDVEEEKR